ncbi:Centromere protein X [Plasmodiophora brassicae]|uniref:Centromere protein X n=1 Tax=Plasmodiophora brassicae TaxID=37360 RepID=A0A0G4IZM6_PLABS|nr:hypothetical protein PBRA_001638 [Plasmodiophora brassicae]SPQ93923.1 unnamed protein product [Plasmodiophora brassicae]
MPDDDNEFRGAIVDRLFRATLSTSGVKVSKEARELTAFYMKQVVLDVLRRSTATAMDDFVDTDALDCIVFDTLLELT